jgi:hypothetical protein
VAAFDRRRGRADRGGTHSCTHWLAWKCGIDRGAAREKVRLGQRCELEHGPALAAETARRLACDASVLSLRHHAQSRPLDRGRSTRTVPAALAGPARPTDPRRPTHHRRADRDAWARGRGRPIAPEGSSPLGSDPAPTGHARPEYAAMRNRLRAVAAAGCGRRSSDGLRSTVHRMPGQRVLEAAKRLALPERLLERPSEAAVTARLGEGLHDVEGFRGLDRLDGQPAAIVARVLVPVVIDPGLGPKENPSRLEVQPVAALPERVTAVQREDELVQVDVQRAALGRAVVLPAVVRAHREMPSASHRNW